MFELKGPSWIYHSLPFRYGNKAIFIMRRESKRIYEQRREHGLCKMTLPDLFYICHGIIITISNCQHCLLFSQISHLLYKQGCWSCCCFIPEGLLHTVFPGSVITTTLKAWGLNAFPGDELIFTFERATVFRPMEPPSWTISFLV